MFKGDVNECASFDDILVRQIIIVPKIGKMCRIIMILKGEARLLVQHLIFSKENYDADL